jgi:hypothetical protein
VSLNKPQKKVTYFLIRKYIWGHLGSLFHLFPLHARDFHLLCNFSVSFIAFAHACLPHLLTNISGVLTASIALMMEAVSTPEMSVSFY